MAVLLCLTRAGGEVVPRARLFDEVWGTALVSDDVLTQAIVELRRAFHERSGSPRIIQTVPRRGYRIALPIRHGSLPDRPPGGDSRPRRHPILLAGLVATLVAAVLAATLYAIDDREVAGEDIQPLRSTVAVLPFETMSAAPEDSMFAEGLQESVIHRLAQSRTIGVIARKSVSKYRNVGSSVQEIANELDVSAVLQGTLRREGDRLLVTAQFADGDTGIVLWSREYAAHASDYFAVQSDMAARIAESLQTNLTPYDRDRLTAAPTRSLEAYGLYLLSLSATRTERLDALDAAIAIDPDFALAYVERAAVHMSRMAEARRAESVAEYRVPWTFGEARYSALDDVQRAIALDPQLGRAFATRGTIHLVARNYAQAEADIDHARTLSPNDPAVLGYAARLKLWLAEPEQGRELLRRFARLDPRNEAITAALFLTGDVDQGYRILVRAATADPTNPTIRHALGVYESLRDDGTSAATELKLAEQFFSESGEPPNPSVLARMAYAYGRVGLGADAERLAEAVLADPASREADRALVALATGRLDLSYEWLAEVPDEFPVLGFLNVLALQLNAFDDPALELPRFRDLRNRFAVRQLASRD